MSDWLDWLALSSMVLVGIAAEILVIRWLSEGGAEWLIRFFP